MFFPVFTDGNVSYVESRVEVLAEIFLRSRRIGGKENAKRPVFCRKIGRLPAFLRNLAAVTGISWRKNSDGTAAVS